MAEKYTDKFSKAEKEMSEKSAFICENCDSKYSQKEAEDRMMSCCGRTLKEFMRESFGP